MIPYGDYYNIPISDNVAPLSSYLDDTGTGTTAFGITGAGDLISRFALRNKQNQIRQNAGLTQVDFEIGNLTNLGSVAFEFWRRNRGSDDNYEYHAETREFLVGELAVGVNTFPINGLTANEGDLIVIRLTATASPCEPFVSKTGVLRSEIREYRSNVAPASSFPWKTQTKIDLTTIAVRFWGQHPTFCFWGDSIISGAYDPNTGAAEHASYAVYAGFNRTVDLENRVSQVSYILAQLLGVTRYQNLGVNSNRTADILGRLTDDVLEQKPALSIIEGGVNDIAGGIGIGTLTPNWTAMLDSASATSNGQVIALSIFPSNNLDDTKSLLRRDWNDVLEALCTNYSNVTYINMDTVLGVVRPSTGELDNVNPLYDAGDGTHLLPIGLGALAETIRDVINANGLL